MRNIILVAICAALLASCGPSKRLSTTSTKDSATATSSTGSIENTKVTITTVDTSVALPADSIEGTVAVTRPQEDFPQDSVVTETIEDDDHQVTVTFKPATGKVHVKAKTKPKNVPVKATTTTLERTKATASTATVTSVKAEAKATEVVNKGPSFWQRVKNWLLILIIIVLLYIIVRRYVPFLP